MLGANGLASALPNVGVYAAQQGAGYTLMLFNFSTENNATTITVGVANAPVKSYSGSMTTYNKAIYDQSQTGIWAGPATQNLWHSYSAFDRYAGAVVNECDYDPVGMHSGFA